MCPKTGSCDWIGIWTNCIRGFGYEDCGKVDRSRFRSRKITVYPEPGQPGKRCYDKDGKEQGKGRWERESASCAFDCCIKKVASELISSGSYELKSGYDFHCCSSATLTSTSGGEKLILKEETCTPPTPPPPPPSIPEWFESWKPKPPKFSRPSFPFGGAGVGR